MKIALFFSFQTSINTWKNNGTLDKELQIFKVLNEKYGFKYKFFTYDYDFDALDSIYDFIEIVGINSKYKFSNYKIIKFLSSFFIPFRYRSHLKNIDLIQQNQLNGSWVSIIAKLIYKKPLFIRTGFDLYLFSINSNKNYLKRIFFKILTWLGLKISNLYSVTSNCDYDFLINNFKFDSQKLVIIPNWVPKIKLQDYSKRFTNKIISVGRLEKQKNYTKLITEFKNSELDFEIDIYGSGSQQNYLKRLAQKNKVKVNFLGNIENNMLIAILQNYKFYISTAIYEGNPKSVLEALASGCVVIASDIDNHKEIIQNGINGFIVPSTNNYFEEFVEISNKNNLDKISNNAASNILKTNSIDLISKKYYENLINLI